MTLLHSSSESQPETQGWPVHEDYATDSGYLRPRGRVINAYDPLAHAELLSEVARVHEGDEKGLVEFARTWGLLGQEETTGIPPEHAESTNWVWGQATNVRMILKLQRYLVSGDREGLSSFLETYRDRLSAYPDAEYVVPVAEPWFPQLIPFSAEDPIKLSESIVAHIINVNLGQLNYRLQPQPWHLYPDIHCPYVAIYWHLTRVVMDGRPIAQCEECRSLFSVRDRRQRFCPPLPDWAGAKGSKCGAKHRKRRQRQKEGG